MGLVCDARRKMPSSNMGSLLVMSLTPHVSAKAIFPRRAIIKTKPGTLFVSMYSCMSGTRRLSFCEENPTASGLHMFIFALLLERGWATLYIIFPIDIV